jgi:hypothetical protein
MKGLSIYYKAASFFELKNSSSGDYLQRCCFNFLASESCTSSTHDTKERTLVSRDFLFTLKIGFK